jgi:hypothetical protein
LAIWIDSRVSWISRAWENGQKTRVFGARGSKIPRTDVRVGPTRKKTWEIQDNTIYDYMYLLVFVEIQYTDHTAEVVRAPRTYCIEEFSVKIRQYMVAEILVFQVRNVLPGQIFS